ncbi:MAG: hypothetical protein HY363_02430 [Candidatus Aenigmarchaeota archaeon]|nr:hypothetical protein [Candidatus Aenigmarchaeota archaeon]
MAKQVRTTSEKYRIDWKLLAGYFLFILLGLYFITGPIQQSFIGPPAALEKLPLMTYFTSWVAIVFYIVVLIVLLVAPPILKEHQVEILMTLGNNPDGMTTWEIMKVTGLHEKEVQRQVGKLKMKLYVHPVGKGKKGAKYELTDYGKNVLHMTYRK